MKNTEHETRNAKRRTPNTEHRTSNNQTSQFPTYRGLDSALPGKLPIAESITEKVICLPLYPELEPEQQNAIVNIIVNV